MTTKTGLTSSKECESGPRMTDDFNYVTEYITRTGAEIPACDTRQHIRWDSYHVSLNVSEGVPACRRGLTHLQTTVPSLGFEPRPYGIEFSAFLHLPNRQARLLHSTSVTVTTSSEPRPPIPFI
ncbi:hypothetical protein TNCV_1446271 [Trichonephila clavipes]|nr:hypothetical protein TNCV_1446271 [Trichonephila clavipes]